MANNKNGRVRPISLQTYLITAALASCISLLMMISRPAVIRIDGRRLVTDVPAITRVHEAFLPLRAVGLGLGAVTAFDPKTGRIEILRNRDTVVLHVGERRALLNGVLFTLPQAPFVVRGRVMVPSRLFESALKSSVRYDGPSQTIEMTSPHSANSTNEDEAHDHLP